MNIIGHGSLWVVLSGILLAGIQADVGAGQQAPLAAPETRSAVSQTPTFKVQVDYVEIDALVTDKQGRFVRDLTKDDFEIFEDGEAQTVSTFALIDVPVEPADRPLFSSEPIEPDVHSNERPFDGRVYVLLLDELHTNVMRSQRVKDAARQFIERNLGANDLMAVVHTAGGSKAAQELTNNKRLLLAAVDKFLGRKLPSPMLARNEVMSRIPGFPVSNSLDPYEVERGYNARSTLSMLRRVAEWFGGVRGRRKPILFLSEGIDYDITKIFNDMNASMRSSTFVDYTNIHDTIMATSRANVSIYAIDPRGLADMSDELIGVSGFAESASDPSETDSEGGGGSAGGGRPIGTRGIANELRLARENLRTLSEETGGFAAVNTNQFATAFERIVRDNSSYYVLAYYPETDRRDGKFYKIDVRVKRPGLTVRARRGYVAPKRNRPPPRTTSNDGASQPVIDALNSPIQLSGLAMRVFAAPFKGTASNASVLFGVEFIGRDLKLAPNDKIELSYLAIDQAGKVYGGRTDRMTMNLRPDTRERVERSAIRLVNRIELPPGRYQLRLAARDTGSGEVGSVISDLEVPDYGKQFFSMSGLVLTSKYASTIPTARSDEQLKDVLPAPPASLRTFPQNDEIALYAEVYDNAGKTPHRVDIVTTMRSDDGTVHFKAEEERDSSELGGARGVYGYVARVPLKDLPPGSYVLTVEARSRLNRDASVSRQVPFTVASAPPAG